MNVGNKHYLGIDVGTTSLKAAVFDEKGQRLGLRSVDYTLDTDPSTGYIEFDADKYITMCRQVIDELEAECGGIDAISVDTQGETMILTDEEGMPLCPAVVWLDNRAEEEAEEIRAQFGNKLVYEVTGQPEITAGWPASKLLWFRKNKPEIWEKARKIFLLEDWILYRLTGNFVTEPTIQSSTTYYDVRNKCWWQQMLDYLGVTAGQLPALCDSAKQVGTYKGIPVVTGALDQIAGMIGVGVVDGTHISEMTGTIMAICAMVDEIPPYDPDSIIPCHIHAIDGKYCLILWSSTAGMALKWFRNQFAEDYSFDDLNDLAVKIPAGSDGMTMLPYFTGSTMPKYNPDARAVFAGLNLSHTRGHFARAIMEAVAFILRQDLEYLGIEKFDEIRITGGGAASYLWPQIKADVTGKVLHTVEESETACLGGAIMAAVGVGDFTSIAEAASEFVHLKKTYAPSGEDYTVAYRKFEELDEKMNRITD
ncbi:MAG: hypothetical protein J6C37_09270 [Roseburia sp.]|nr:hypothetical protein [Roseburia sp.]